MNEIAAADLGDAVRFQQIVEMAPNALLMVDREGRIVVANAQTEAMFGYARTELIGQKIEMLVPQRLRGAHPSFRDDFYASPNARPMGAGRDLFAVRTDGSEFPVEIGLNPVQSDAGPMVLGSVVDITERKRAEHRIASALAEKTALLKEIHHRVKNNLQVISSLLSLQSSHSPEPAARAELAEAPNRVKAMAMIHQLLYERSDLSRVDLGDYLQRLGDLLAKTYGLDSSRVRFAVQPAPMAVELDLHRAVPCGLVVVELVTNAFKHAFPGGRSGKVGISLENAADGHAVLVVEDDGVGMPAGWKDGSSSNLGLQLVPLLANQLQASLVRPVVAGTRIELHFPIEVPEEAAT